ELIRNPAEGGAGRRIVRVLKHRMVEGVEEFAVILKPRALADREALDQRQIEVRDRIPAQIRKRDREAAQIVAELLSRGGHELRGVEDAIYVVRVPAQIAAEIDRVVPLQHVARLARVDAAHRPSAYDLVREAARGSEDALAAADRELIHTAHHRAERAVDIGHS